MVKLYGAPSSICNENMNLSEQALNNQKKIEFHILFQRPNTSVTEEYELNNSFVLKAFLIMLPIALFEEYPSFKTKTLTVGTIKESPIASRNPEIINKNDEINVVNL